MKQLSPDILEPKEYQKYYYPIVIKYPFKANPDQLSIPICQRSKNKLYFYIFPLDSDKEKNMVYKHKLIYLVYNLETETLSAIENSANIMNDQDTILYFREFFHSDKLKIIERVITDNMDTFKQVNKCLFKKQASKILYNKFYRSDITTSSIERNRKQWK